MNTVVEKKKIGGKKETGGVPPTNKYIDKAVANAKKDEIEKILNYYRNIKGSTHVC